MIRRQVFLNDPVNATDMSGLGDGFVGGIAGFLKDNAIGILIIANRFALDQAYNEYSDTLRQLAGYKPSCPKYKELQAKLKRLAAQIKDLQNREKVLESWYDEQLAPYTPPAQLL